MKKRKKPIFLVAVFVLLFCAVAAMNSNLLNTPTTMKEIQEQAEQEALEQNPTAPKPVATNKPAPPPADQSFVSFAEDNDDMGTNIKAIPAIKDTDAKIAAPLNRKNREKSVDQATISAQGQWYHRDGKK